MPTPIFAVEMHQLHTLWLRLPRLRDDCLCHDAWIDALEAEGACDICGYFDPQCVEVYEDGIHRCASCYVWHLSPYTWSVKTRGV